MNILGVTSPASLLSGWRPLLPVALRLPEAQGFPHICAHYFSDKDKNKTHICAHFFEEFFSLLLTKRLRQQEKYTKKKHLCALLSKDVKSFSWAILPETKTKTEKDKPRAMVPLHNAQHAAQIMTFEIFFFLIFRLL